MKKLLLLIATTLFAISTVQAKVEVGNQLPSFTLPHLKSESKLSSQSLHGKVVLVDFWASWCVPCRASFAAFERLHEEFHSKGLTIVGINVDKDNAAALNFLKQNPVSFTLLKGNNEVSSHFDLSTMPMSYLVNKQGKVEKIYYGFKKSEESDLKERIEKLL